MPAVSLTLGAGVVYLLNNKNMSRQISVAIIIISVGLMLTGGIYQIKDFYNINHPEIVEAGKMVDKLTPSDALVVAPYNGDSAFLYQTNRWGWPAVDDSFGNIIKNGADFYVSVTPTDADSVYILKNYKVIYQTDKYFIADLSKII